jgi:hypothetical protein
MIDRLRLLSLFCLFFTVTVSSDGGAQTAIQFSKCSIQNVGYVRVERQIIYCGDKADPRRALKISYFWLDPYSASLLAAGRIEGRLRELLGGRPIVMNNEVSAALSDLIQKFGTAVGAHSTFNGDVEIVAEGNRRTRRIFKAGTVSAFGNDDSFIYDGLKEIYWPDIEAIVEMQTTNSFPRGYKSYVRQHKEGDILSTNSNYRLDTQNIMDAALYTRIFAKNIERRELENYEERLLKLRDLALTGSPRLYFPNGLEPDGPTDNLTDDTKAQKGQGQENSNETSRLTKPGNDLGDANGQGDERLKFLPNLADNKSVEALLYVTRDGMPSDFVAAYGVHESHAGELLGWSIVVIPRHPFLKIAIIENAAEVPTDYSFKHVVTTRERDTGLRDPAIAGPVDEVIIPYPPERLSYHERIVIPLSIEFRDHRSYGSVTPFENVTPSNEMYKALRRALDRLSKDDIVGGVELALPPKPKKLFFNNNPPVIKPAYAYGPRLSLKSALIEEREVPIRQSYPTTVMMVAGYAGQTCQYFTIAPMMIDGTAWGQSSKLRRGQIGNVSRPILFRETWRK